MVKRVFQQPASVLNQESGALAPPRIVMLHFVQHLVGGTASPDSSLALRMTFCSGLVINYTRSGASL